MRDSTTTVSDASEIPPNNQVEVLENGQDFDGGDSLEDGFNNLEGADELLD